MYASPKGPAKGRIAALIASARVPENPRAALDGRGSSFAPTPAQEAPAAEAKVGFVSPPSAPRPSPARQTPVAQGRTELLATHTDLIRKFADNINQVITGPGGPCELRKDIQELVIAFKTKNGVVFICSRTDSNNPKIAEARALLRSREFPVSHEIYADISVIQSLYAKLREGESVDYTKKDIRNSSDESVEVGEPALAFLKTLHHASQLRASDIQIIRSPRATRVEMILDDEISVLGEYTGEWGRSVVHTVATNSQVNGGDRRVDRHQEGVLAKGKAWHLPKNVEGVRLQFNVLAGESEMLNARLFYSTSEFSDTVTVRDLGYLIEQSEVIERAYNSPDGALLMSGPTGSGKSTTIRTILNELIRQNDYKLNVLTVENPQEVPIKGAKALLVRGTGTAEEVSRSYVEAITAALRSAPRVLFFGEGRNKEELEPLFTGAKSGHVCMTTVHTNTAMLIISRLLDEGISKADLLDPSIVRLLIGQRLVPQLCPSCSIPLRDMKTPNIRVMRRLERAFEHEPSLLEGVRFSNPSGCSVCNGRGTKGRRICSEVVEPNTRLLEIAVNESVPAAQEYWVKELGGFTFYDHAILHLIQGTIGVDGYEKKLGHLDVISSERINRIKGVIAAEKEHQMRSQAA